jgi:hypothetical protein
VQAEGCSLNSVFFSSTFAGRAFQEAFGYYYILTNLFSLVLHSLTFYQNTTEVLHAARVVVQEAADRVLKDFFPTKQIKQIVHHGWCRIPVFLSL